ncbi:DUF4189 domain-containing protein [Vulcaniibacterium thermophilum]|uniref:DUF4189 domain-containing protein n=1 Tax=Vulcaniibacterium thermophilum TaxID=1169913 RepID=A0A918Z9W3_9GAMM|nr:DUF4189 domain-containing protein [Vulcaniibacterium thermophilum]GHE43082.1 hypothetical protein GCM10007167_26140 [Vulcaniibacterium thermophilum]
MSRHWILLLGFLSLSWFWASRADAAQVCQDVMVGMSPGGNGLAPHAIYQTQCAWVAGAIAFDVRTRVYSAAWNHASADEALDAAIAQCGRHCVGQSFYTDFVWVAMADDDSAYGVSLKSAEDALRQCTFSGGRDCAVVLGGSSTAAPVYWGFSALSYDPATGASGRSFERRRRSVAVAEATERCGAPGCWTFAYQGGYAAIARSADGRLFAEWTPQKNVLINAERKARSACKRATGDKECKIVMSAGPEAVADDTARFIEETKRQLEHELERIEREHGKFPADAEQ